MMRFLLLIAISLFVFTEAFSQVKALKYCAAVEQDSINRRLYPEMQDMDELENDIQKKINEIELKSHSQRIQDLVITIPIIVHVVNKGEAVGTGSNISLDQVKSQIEVLNEDFRKKVGSNGENSNPVGADIEIEFCLAEYDNSGKKLEEPGIHRYNGNKDKWIRDDIEGVLKPATYWNPDKYYNIWTLDFGAEDANLLGYAQFPSKSNLPGLQPSGGPASTDGVVVSYRHFGSSEKGSFPVLSAPYNKGRTLTHETGHYLGLRHIWGDGPCGSDDYVNDTPDSDAASSGCQKGRVSCGVTNMVENYMDYSEDGCMNIFTKGQKARIRAVMEICPQRNSLTFSNVCAPSVATKPRANFKGDNLTILRDDEVSFTDLSSNNPTRWRWTFEGGEPATSTLRNPIVKYHISDTVKVTLIAGNALGADTIVKDNYIVVSKFGICGDTTNFQGTPTIIKVPVAGKKGYLAGHNTIKHKAKAEFFENVLRYSYVNRARIRFSKAYSTKDDARVKVTVWNARGAQNSPGAIVEETEVLIKRIQQDIAKGQPTEVVFTRQVPLFKRGFYIGIQLEYNGDSVAIYTNANGETSITTGWQMDEKGAWKSYSETYGINVAHDIEAVIGKYTSLQIAASDLYVNPGDKVTLNAKGSGFFSWTSDDGKVKNALGAQLNVYPGQNTTYTVTGLGTQACDSSASITLFVNNPTAIDDASLSRVVKVYPNPTNSKVKVEFSNSWMGEGNIELFNPLGGLIINETFKKDTSLFSREFDFTNLSTGVYILQVKVKNGAMVRKKIFRN